MTFKPSWKGVWLFESQDEASRLPPDRRWDILRRARSHVEGFAMVVCLEAWSQGAEEVFGLQNLAYNIRRLVTLERMAAA
jgi:hypothetical protein